jgi:hypothetical protein
MDELRMLESMGLELPTPTYLFGLVLFGVIGYAAYRHGKKTALPTCKWLGVALMLYPYAVSSTGLLYLVGAALCVGLYFFRK